MWRTMGSGCTPLLESVLSASQWSMVMIFAVLHCWQSSLRQGWTKLRDPRACSMWLIKQTVTWGPAMLGAWHRCHQQLELQSNWDSKAFHQWTTYMRLRLTLYIHTSVDLRLLAHTLASCATGVAGIHALLQVWKILWLCSLRSGSCKHQDLW